MVVYRNPIPSTKQWKQRKLYRAIGTVTGFHGYLHNLEGALKQTELYKNLPQIDAMHDWLKHVETILRNDIRNIK